MSEKIKSNPKNDEMVQSLVIAGVLHTPVIIEAFRHVDRQLFVRPEVRDQATADRPLSIGHGQTISQPLTVAIMLELIQPKPREHILDVGAGSGWVTGLLAWLVGDRGSVTAVERIAALTEQARKNLAPFEFRQVTLTTDDASQGWESGAPYDVIHVAAAAKELPDAYRQQLAIGGRLIIPVGEPVQDLVFLLKTGENTFSERRIPGFQFVPLVSSSIDDRQV